MKFKFIIKNKQNKSKQKRKQKNFQIIKKFIKNKE